MEANLVQTLVGKLGSEVDEIKVKTHSDTLVSKLGNEMGEIKLKSHSDTGQ